MQKFSESLFTKQLVVSCVKNELMPQVIHNLRRHSHRFAATFEICQKKFSQRSGDKVMVFRRKLRPDLAQFFHQALGKGIVPDVFDASQLTTFHPVIRCEATKDCNQ